MNKITFDTIVQNERDTFSFVSVPETLVKEVPESGYSSDIPSYDRETQAFQFSFASLLTRKEAGEALGKVRVECNKVAAMSLFQLPNKHMKIEEFEQTQNQQTSKVSIEKLEIKIRFEANFFYSLITKDFIVLER
jgi:dynein heavy chain, axonemal